MKAQKWVLAKHFEGKPTAENLQLVEEELPELEVNRKRLQFDFIKKIKKLKFIS